LVKNLPIRDKSPRAIFTKLGIEEEVSGLHPRTKFCRHGFRNVDLSAKIVKMWNFCYKSAPKGPIPLSNFYKIWRGGESQVKGKGLDTCYSATYMSQTLDQQCLTISEVAADWHEPTVPQCIMWPSIARANRQLDPRCC